MHQTQGRQHRQDAEQERSNPWWRRNGRQLRTGRLLGAVLLGVAMLGGVACGVTDEGTLPPDVEDPSNLQTPDGAMGLYRVAVFEFPAAFEGAIGTGGILSDELAALPLALGTFGPVTSLDSRQAPTFSPNRLHRLRAQAREARGFLGAYAPDSAALRGHLYALEGYADVFLADLFCSGIPLSTVDFDGNYTLAAGSTTSEVYQHARDLFDTALTLTSGNPPFHHLAAVGRGRALLAMGQYAEAAAAVAGVPDGYQYQVSIPLTTTNAFSSGSAAPPADSLQLLWFWTRTTAVRRVGAPGVADQEGGTGLDYRSSGDPRTWAVSRGTDGINTLFIANKYARGGTPTAPTVLSPVALTLADGIEARLIEAEAALQANSEDGLWLQKLNHLRQTMWPTIFPAVAGPLADLADPGNTPERVDLLFRERAFWLYLTGHRQGDLRRLIRQYPNRLPEAVYPTGAYPGGDTQYGNEIVIPMPEAERRLNPKYTGCFHSNA